MTTETILTTDAVDQICDENESLYDFARAIEQAVMQSPEIQALRRDAEHMRAALQGTASMGSMKNKLFGDLKTDEEKSNFFLSGRAYETGIIASSMQNDVAMAFHRCAEYEKEIQALRRDAERYRWLRDPCSGAEHVVMYGRGDYGKGLKSCSTLDDDIDAAMEQP